MRSWAVAGLAGSWWWNPQVDHAGASWAVLGLVVVGLLVPSGFDKWAAKGGELLYWRSLWPIIFLGEYVNAGEHRL